MTKIGDFVGFLRSIFRVKAEKPEVTLCKVFDTKTDSF
jgi:hypothetical protein